jgi:hypothetical protein
MLDMYMDLEIIFPSYISVDHLGAGPQLAIALVRANPLCAYSDMAPLPIPSLSQTTTLPVNLSHACTTTLVSSRLFSGNYALLCRHSTILPLSFLHNCFFHSIAKQQSLLFLLSLTIPVQGHLFQSRESKKTCCEIPLPFVLWRV